MPEGGRSRACSRPTRLPYVIQLGKHGDLKIDGEERVNIIVDGEATLGLDAKAVAVDKQLRIQNFTTTTDTVLIQVDVGRGLSTSLVGLSSDDGSAPVSH